MTEFVGAKAALFWQGHILTYQRDEKPDLPWPGLWDLPGGAREGVETAEQCLFREVHEEFGLTLAPAHLTWCRVFPAMLDRDQKALFFAGVLARADTEAIRFGDEGQRWCLMPIAEWLSHSNAVPELQRRTKIAATALGLA